jgi:serine/threonine-protein kinase
MKKCNTCNSTYPTSYSLCPVDGTALVEVSAWSQDTVVAGKYRIIEKIGQGAMAVVYKAVHVHFSEIRALKVMAPGLASDAAFVKRFMQEAVITRKLQHPNAVRVDDIEQTEDGRPFIVMEYIEGRSLKDLIERKAPLPVDLVGSIVKQVAAALDAAHSLGMVHRDIKPSNIFLLTSTEVPPVGQASGDRTRASSVVAKVLDFGVARMKEIRREDAPEQGNLTVTGMVLGTAAYMSPEQAVGKRGDELDGRSDLYSLGVVMYQILTGELPLKADSEIGFLMAHIQTPVTDIRTKRPDVPEALAALVMSCLEKNREARPATGAAVIKGIEDSEEAFERAARERAAFEPTKLMPGIRASSDETSSSAATDSALPNQAPGQAVSSASLGAEAQAEVRRRDGLPSGSAQPAGLVLPGRLPDPSTSGPRILEVLQERLAVASSAFLRKLTEGFGHVSSAMVRRGRLSWSSARSASSWFSSGSQNSLLALALVIVLGGGYLAKTILARHQHATHETKPGSEAASTPGVGAKAEGSGSVPPSSTSTQASSDQPASSPDSTSPPPSDTSAKQDDAGGDATANGAGDLTVPRPTTPPQLTQTAAPKRIRVYSTGQEGKLVYDPPPKYPDVARDAHVEGVVQIDALFGTDGRVQDLKLISGHPLLVKAAMDAVRHWRWQPVRENGEPVEVQTEVAVKFALRPAPTPPPTLGPTGTPKEGADHVRRGDALAKAGNWDGAIGEYRQAISLQPNSAEAYKGLALVLAQKRDWNGEIAAMSHAIRLKPDDAEEYENLGAALGWLGDWDGEISAEQKALSLRPGYPGALNALGVGLERKGRKQAALEEYRQAHQLSPDSTTIQANYDRLAKMLGQQ